ncbi:MAG: hypothetical protein WC241_05180 [Candidatus Paceibacterota bacterium]|jgi:hypothetical protein
MATFNTTAGWAQLVTVTQRLGPLMPIIVPIVATVLAGMLGTVAKALCRHIILVGVLLTLAIQLGRVAQDIPACQNVAAVAEHTVTGTNTTDIAGALIACSGRAVLLIFARAISAVMHLFSYIRFSETLGFLAA